MLKMLETGTVNSELAVYFALYQTWLLLQAPLAALLQFVYAWIEPRYVQTYYREEFSCEGDIRNVCEYILSQNPATINKEYGKGKSVAPGRYVVTLKGKWCIFGFSSKKDTTSRIELFSVTIWTLSTDKLLFTDLNAIAGKSGGERDSVPQIYIQDANLNYNSYVSAGKLVGFCQVLGPVPKRDWKNTIVTSAVYNAIVGDIKRFRQKPDLYARYQIPHRLCYLISGPPGMGKTSAIKALASEEGLNIYFFTTTISDDKIPLVLQAVLPDSIVCFEDADCMSSRSEGVEQAAVEGPFGRATPKSGMSLSGLLNALDGLTSAEGLIIILTTNHPDKLDPALVRQGRVHRHVKLEKCAEVYEKMYERFFPGKVVGLRDFVDSCLTDSLSLSEAQAKCVQAVEQLVFEK